MSSCQRAKLVKTLPVYYGIRLCLDLATSLPPFRLYNKIVYTFLISPTHSTRPKYIFSALYNKGGNEIGADNKYACLLKCCDALERIYVPVGIKTLCFIQKCGKCWRLNE